jgi:hypothetical protein
VSRFGKISEIALFLFIVRLSELVPARSEDKPPTYVSNIRRLIFPER